MTEEISTTETSENGVTAEKGDGEKKEWAVLVYLGGENNLLDEMVFAIKEMKSSVPTPPDEIRRRTPRPEFKFNALVQFAAEEPSYPTSALKVPRRFILKPWDIDGELNKDY